MENLKITSGLEDYIEVISNILKANGKVRAIDIAKNLNVSRASVSEALKRLNELGYINYDRYSSIEITNKGELAAQSVIRRHNLLHKFLADILTLNEDEANGNACKIEHVISSEFIDKLDKFVNFYTSNTDYSEKFKEYLNKNLT